MGLAGVQNDTTAITYSILPYYRNLKVISDSTHYDHKVSVTIDAIILSDTNGYSVVERDVSGTCDISTSGAGGLDTGSPAAATWYYLWCIGGNRVPNFVFSTSLTEPTLPTGYTFFALLGAYRRSSLGLYKIKQVNNTIVYGERLTIKDGSFVDTPAWTALAAHTGIPPNAKKGYLAIGSSGNEMGLSAYSDGYGGIYGRYADAGGSDGFGVFATARGNVLTGVLNLGVDWDSPNYYIYYWVTSANSTLMCLGYEL